MTQLTALTAVSCDGMIHGFYIIKRPTLKVVPGHRMACAQHARMRSIKRCWVPAELNVRPKRGVGGVCTAPVRLPVLEEYRSA